MTLWKNITITFDYSIMKGVSVSYLFIMKKKIFYLIIIFLISFKSHSLEVTLTQGTIKPTPIAITNFYSKEDKVY